MKRRGIPAHLLTEQGIAVCLFPEQPPTEPIEEFESGPVKNQQVFAQAPSRYKDNEEWEEEEDGLRENFTNRGWYFVCFLTFCISLHNVYYFPLFMNTYGGGSFFLAYTILTFFFAYPLHLIQSALGQYSRSGIVKIWNISPIFRGVGWVMCGSAIIVSIIHNMHAAYSLVHIATSFRTYPPWYDCYDTKSEQCAPRICAPRQECPYTPGQHYFYHYVVNRQESNPLLTKGMGFPLWWIILPLFYAWCVVFVCCRQGIRSLERTAPFLLIVSYFGLFTTLVLAVQLSGAGHGLYWMFHVDRMILSYRTWHSAAVQIVNELGITHGVPLVYGTFCTSKSRCQYDSLYICIINFLNSMMCGAICYSLLGYLSVHSETEMGTYLLLNSGLIYATDSEAFSRLPINQLWSVLFFFALFCIVIGTINGLILTITVAIFDLNQEYKKYRALITLVLCLVLFIVGILVCFSSGFYVIHLVDFMPISRTVLLAVGLFLLGIVYFYKLTNFNKDCYDFLYFKPIGFSQFCLYVAPIILLILGLAGMIDTHVPTVDRLYYAFISYMLYGWLLIIAFVLAICIFAVLWIQKCIAVKEMKYILKPEIAWDRDRGGIVGSKMKY